MYLLGLRAEDDGIMLNLEGHDILLIRTEVIGEQIREMNEILKKICRFLDTR